jgi:hypothetical protein
MKDYLAKVRALRCFNCWDPGPCEAHHHTSRRGLGQRARDVDAMPLCLVCHRAFHDASGPFKKWTRAQRRELQDDGVADTQKRLGVYTVVYPIDTTPPVKATSPAEDRSPECPCDAADEF